MALLDEADAKGLILGRQSWKEYKHNNEVEPEEIEIEAAAERLGRV